MDDREEQRLMYNFIEIRGAKENTLKNISLNIPKNKLVVFSGMSGSGKSTLALNTLQRECQRQYMESMGMVADLLSKPKVDAIYGLSPSISVDQHNSNRNPRSTVGTITDVAAFLRVLYAKLGERHCPKCNELIIQSYEDDRIVENDDSNNCEIEELQVKDYEEDAYSETYITCPHCGEKIVELSVSHFSFNKPQGACPTCKGLGIVSTPNVDLIMNKKLSIMNGAINGWDKAYINRYSESIVNCGKHYGFEISADTTIEEYNEIQLNLLLYGVFSLSFQRYFPNVAPPKTVPLGRFEGVVTNLMRRYSEQTTGSSGKSNIEKVLIQKQCPDCNGSRYRSEILDVKLDGLNIEEISSKSLYEVMTWVKALPNVTEAHAFKIVQPIVDNLVERLQRLFDVGIGYLSLNRSAPTLSPGEAQRLRLASLLGSGLTGVLYILDEPTAGLHASDTANLINVLKKLRDLGNTVLVIEHDVEMMEAADYIVDFGPQAGKYGGEIVAVGTPKEVEVNSTSVTGKFLFLKPAKLPVLTKKSLGEKSIEIYGAKQNNLKNIDVTIPLGGLVSVTGVSGSGKSSLIFQTLNLAAERHFKNAKEEAGVFDKIIGFDNINDIITIDQVPIGRTPRSNAATYTDVFNDFRDLFASTSQAKMMNLNSKYFSFNTPGGRCEKCQGAGEINVSMHFLPDVQVECPVCHGKRFQKRILDIKFNDVNISDVLRMSIDEALEVFQSVKSIASKLSVLKEVGLGYLGLGQPATTLSGGEAQRIKLAKELSKKGKGHVLYLLDEPTTGLHPLDVIQLVKLLRKLIQQGNSIIVVEHNLDVIKQSDWIIDIGPNGGSEGGKIVAQGTVKDIIQCESSKTGQILKKLFM